MSLKGVVDVEYGPSVVVCICIKRGIEWNSEKNGFFSHSF